MEVVAKSAEGFVDFIIRISDGPSCLLAAREVRERKRERERERVRKRVGGRGERERESRRERVILHMRRKGPNRYNTPECGDEEETTTVDRGGEKNLLAILRRDVGVFDRKHLK